MLCAQLVWGQSPAKLVTAKIVADSSAIDKVNVLNLRDYKTAITNKEGIFTILLREGDVLVITGITLKPGEKSFLPTTSKKKSCSSRPAPK
jgi:hypothetical protein